MLCKNYINHSGLSLTELSNEQREISRWALILFLIFCHLDDLKLKKPPLSVC